MAPRSNLAKDQEADLEQAESTEGGASFGTTEQLVFMYTRCRLCGSHLHFSQVTDFSQNLTQESTRCPECGYGPKTMVHKLQ